MAVAVQQYRLPMATISKVKLQSGLTLSYAQQGDARDVALVLLPGPTDSWRSYQPVLDRLPPSMHTVAVSLRGHGDSDKPKIGYRVEDYAVDVVGFLDALGIERAVLGGHSGSSLVARRVALEHPDRVAGLVLEASPTTLRGDAGLQEFVQSVVSSFEKSMAQLLATMHAAASRGEAQPLARAAHQVKGAAANLHATTVSALAADLEANAKILSQAQMRERLNRLALEIGRATAALQNFAADGGRRASAS